MSLFALSVLVPPSLIGTNGLPPSPLYGTVDRPFGKIPYRGLLHTAGSKHKSIIHFMSIYAILPPPCVQLV